MSTNGAIHPLRVSRLAGCLAIALGIGSSVAFAGAVNAQHARTAPKSHREPVIHEVQSCDDMSLRQAITSALDGGSAVPTAAKNGVSDALSVAALSQ